MKSCITIIICIFCSIMLFANEKEMPVQYQFDNFYSIQPSDRSELKHKTICKINYDQQNIYVYWEAEIDSSFKTTKRGRKDDMQDADFLRTQISTLPGDSFCYVFYVYPDGSVTDAIRDGDFNVNTNWDSHAKAENQFINSVWYSTLTIPFKDLRYNGVAPYQWNFSFCRQFFDASTLYSSPFLSIAEMGQDYFINGHSVSITEQLPVQLNTQVIPYYVPVYDIKHSESLYKEDQMGLDINFKPLSLVNLKVSVNPDFSDIPPDRAQNTFNLKNEQYQNENRYFFTEDLNVFDIDTDILYTRKIIQPEFAAKLNGTSDHLTYGLMYCKDKDSDAQIYKNNQYSIFTLKPKWENKELFLAYIRQENDFYKNSVIQINPSFYLTPNTSITWKNNITFYQDTTSVKEGLDTFLDFYTRNRNFNQYFKLGFYTKDFIAKMGRIYDPSIAYSEYFEGDFNYFCNLQYDINRDIALYAGLSKRAYEINKTWNTDYNTFYLKFRAVLNF